MGLLDSDRENYLIMMKQKGRGFVILDEEGSQLGHAETPVLGRMIKIRENNGGSIVAFLKKRLFPKPIVSAVYWGDLLSPSRELLGKIKHDNTSLNPRKLQIWLEDMKGKTVLVNIVKTPENVELLGFKAAIIDSEGSNVAEVSEDGWKTVFLHVLDKDVNRLFLLPLVLCALLIRKAIGSR